MYHQIYPILRLDQVFFVAENNQLMTLNSHACFSASAPSNYRDHKRGRGIRLRLYGERTIKNLN